MKLSVIIVNYNVKHFLEHCLISVEKAIGQMNVEVFVVDNNSSDGSRNYFENRFTNFEFIYNKENVGFAKANNMAVAKATGEYILFLNPDTIIAEDCFEKCISFMESNSICGGLGVRMIDGSGNFLKESKRAFPAPITAFYKLVGLANLFPKSEKFAKYHLGSLPDNENHEVDVLAGAFMLVPKKILDEIGSFDEAFFMYGEDVDLSYRIQKAGYKNYYFAGTTIIHFKGESTKRGSLNYVRIFYKAMSQFVTKHYGNSKASSFNFFIQIAIFLRGTLSAIKRALQWIGLPLIDFAIMLLCIWVVKLFWYANIKPNIRYIRSIVVTSAILYTIIYQAIAFLNGLYDKPFMQKKLNKSALIATIILLAIYGMLPENVRYSRGIILGSGILIFIVLSLLRYILGKTEVLEYASSNSNNKLTIALANANDYEKIKAIYARANMSNNLIGNIDLENNTEHKELSSLQKTITPKNLILSNSSMAYSEIIKQTEALKNHQIKYYTPNALSIIGSNNKNEIGEIIMTEGQFNINTATAKRTKRTLDFFCALLLLLFSPIVIIFSTKKSNYFNSLFEILIGKKTFVGYCNPQSNLPKLKNCLLGTIGVSPKESSLFSENLLTEMDTNYAKNYYYKNDLSTIWEYYFGG